MDRVTQLLLVLVLAALLAPSSGPPRAYAQQAGGDSMFAVTAPGSAAGKNVLFVIDPAKYRLAIYEYQSKGKLELRAVRNMEGELSLDEWPQRKAGRQIPPPKLN
jgi:hypothetical protein